MTKKNYGTIESPSELIEVKSADDVKAAAKVLADAFKNDVHILWFFGSKENYEKHSQRIFESWVWYGVLYGHVYKNPESNCIAMLKEPGHYGFTVWGMIWSGMIFNSIWRLGISGCLRMAEYDSQSGPRAKTLPTTPNFWYLWQIGVSTEGQGKGVGGKVADLVEKEIISRSEGKSATVYLEAVSKGSARFFENRGYKRLETYDLEYSKNNQGPPVVCMEITLEPK